MKFNVNFKNLIINLKIKCLKDVFISFLSKKLLKEVSQAIFSKVI